MPAGLLLPVRQRPHDAVPAAGNDHHIRVDDLSGALLRRDRRRAERVHAAIAVSFHSRWWPACAPRSPTRASPQHVAITKLVGAEQANVALVVHRPRPLVCVSAELVDRLLDRPLHAGLVHTESDDYSEGVVLGVVPVNVVDGLVAAVIPAGEVPALKRCGWPRAVLIGGMSETSGRLKHSLMVMLPSHQALTSRPSRLVEQRPHSEF